MAHTSDSACFTSEVFIVYKDKLLLRRHRKFRDMWLSVGGHIDPGEDPVQAAIREVKEEVGLDAVIYGGNQKFHASGTDTDTYRDLIPPIALGRHSVGDGRDHVVFVYFGTVASDQLTLETAEDECRWVTREEMEQMDLVENVRMYARGAFDLLAG